VGPGSTLDGWNESESHVLTFRREGSREYRKGRAWLPKMTYPHVAIGVFFLILSIGGIYRHIGRQAGDRIASAHHDGDH